MSDERRNGWIPTDAELPEDGIEVDTIIDDAKAGPRNHQSLVRQGNLWFFPDRSMCYYTPTHWRELIEGDS